MKFFNFKDTKGFTLLEILVVISIIGILIALGASAYSVAQRKGRDARRQGDLKQIQNAFEQYYAANSSSYAACATMDNVFPSTTMPTDPKNSGTSVYTCTVNTGTVVRYCVCALLESGTGNATNAGSNGTFSFGSGNYYCVTNLQ